MNWSYWIAIYAAIVGTLALGWEVLQWWFSRRGRISVCIWEGTILSTQESKIKKIVVNIQAINKGDKEVYLISAGFKTKNEEEFIITTPELPAKLEGGNCQTLRVGRETVLNNITDTPIIKGWFRDALGKIYYSKPIKIKTTLKEVLEGD